MFSFNPKKWGLPQPWYFRFKFDRGHGRWLIEVQENGHDWFALTAITNNKIETLDFATLKEAVIHAKVLGLPEVYQLYGLPALPKFDTQSELPGVINVSETQSTPLATASLRAVSARAGSK